MLLIEEAIELWKQDWKLESQAPSTCQMFSHYAGQVWLETLCLIIFNFKYNL